jgi:hypothetical protein
VGDLLTATWKAPAAPGYKGAIQRTVNAVVLDRLMALAGDEHASAQVRGVASLELDDLKKWIAAQVPPAKDYSVRSQLFFARSQIDRFQRNPAETHPPTPAPPPDGDPIGSDDWE